MASHCTHMLRFASCRASSRTYMCVPESWQSRSLASERRAVPYPVAELGARSGVTRLAKPCLRASDCVPSCRWIACGLESKLHSDMALQEIRMRRFGSAEHPHAHKTCAPASRPVQSLAYERLTVSHGVARLQETSSSRPASRDLDAHPRTVYGNRIFPPLLAGEG